MALNKQLLEEEGLAKRSELRAKCLLQSLAGCMLRGFSDFDSAHRGDLDGPLARRVRLLCGLANIYCLGATAGGAMRTL